MVIEEKLLISFESLKYFYAILLGQQLKIYSDHKIITCNILILIEYLDGD